MISPFNFLKRLFLALSCCCFIFAGSAVIAGLKCYECGKSISGKYYKKDGSDFCSEKCIKKYIERQLPVCSVCDRKIRGRYLKKDGKFFCSRKCFEKILPECSLCGKPVTHGVYFNGSKKTLMCRECASKPKCSSCFIPGNCRRLNDGRYLCEKCEKTAVFDKNRAKQIFDEVRRKMKNRMRLSTGHNISFELVGQREMKQNSAGYTHGLEQGVFIYGKNTQEKVRTFAGILHKKTKTVHESFRIMVLFGLSRNKMIEVLAHELAHDWMQERYPDIKDLKIKEGWAEFVASKVNEIYGNHEMNNRMLNNPDPVYGEGYRYIKNIYDKGGMKTLEYLFREYDTGDGR
jgi:hypothetical protein